jgi:RND superfamily putative drug exporter
MSSPVPRRACRRRTIARLAIWTVVLFAGAAAASQVFGLPASLDPAPSTEAATADRQLTELTSSDGQIVALLAGDPTDPAHAGRITATSAQLRLLDGVVDVVDQPSTNSDALVADDRTSSLIVVRLASGLDDDQIETVVAATRTIIRTELGDDVRLAGGTIIDEELGATAEADFLRADAIALPIVLALLAVALRSRRAALIGLVMVLVTITGSFLALYTLSLITDVSVFAINVVTMFGIGLTVDYCLLVIGRYRRELADGHSHSIAVERATSRAGRVVTFSGLTVAVALAGLIAFREPVIRSLGYGGIAATLVAVAAARTLLPILLGRFAGHIPPATTPHSTHDPAGGFARFTRFVQSHALTAVAIGIGLIAVFALPLRSLTLTGLDERSLPPDSVTRQVSRTIDAQFPAIQTHPIHVLIDPAPGDALDEFTEQVAQLSGVRTMTITDLGAVTLIDVSSTGTASDQRARQLVHDIRALTPPEGSTVAVTGEAAEDVDLTDSIRERLPAATAIIVIGTLLLLIVFTGSLLIPVKAVFLTGASLAASLGVLTFVFQQGHFADLIGFTPIGGLDPITLLLAATFAFGLATDYEVFVLGAILEEHHQGTATRQAVERGMQTTGRTITTAAALIITVFVGFATGDLAIVKQLGIGLAVAVTIDATLIRLVLVPATMTIAGQRNWWAPARLRRLTNALRIEHT